MIVIIYLGLNLLTNSAFQSTVNIDLLFSIEMSNLYHTCIAYDCSKILNMRQLEV